MFQSRHVSLSRPSISATCTVHYDDLVSQSGGGSARGGGGCCASFILLSWLTAMDYK